MKIYGEVQELWSFLLKDPNLPKCLLAIPRPSKMAVTHASGLIMLTYICKQHLIKIYMWFYSFWAIQLTAYGRTDSHSDNSADPRVVQ